MTRRLRLALLHLAPEVGAVGANRALVERATRLAAGADAAWVVSGELVISGYRFAPVIGMDWIRQQPDTWMAEYARLHRELGVVSFLSHPERGRDGQLFNSVFVISRDGEIIGRQRKLYPIPVSEDWSSPGEPGSPVTVDGINVGIVICADAYDERPARQLPNSLFRPPHGGPASGDQMPSGKRGPSRRGGR